MQSLGFQVCVPAEHLPVFMASNEGDLLDRKSGFEEAACAFVPEVMKVKVFDFECAALASEGRTHRSSVVGENSGGAIAGKRALLFDDSDGIVARHVKQRNTLAVPALPPRILAISDEEHLFEWIEVIPFNSADLVQAHRRRDREANDAPDGNLLKAICLETSDQAIQLILGRSPVTFIPFADERKARERNARQSNGLSREYHAVNGGRVRQNGLDITQIDTESDGAGALSRPLFSELDEPCAIELRNSEPSQPLLEKGKARRLGSPDGFSYLPKVFAMEIDQIAERLGVPGASHKGRVATIDAPLDIERPFLRVLSAKECVVDIFSFPPHLNSPGTGIELRERRQGVFAPCALSRRIAA